MNLPFVWWLFVTVFNQTTWATWRFHNKTECHDAGVDCPRLSACRFDTLTSKYSCLCVAGFKGHKCDEDVNECDTGRAPCLKRGVCHNFVGSFRCDCLPGWRGSHCQTSDGSGQGACPVGYTGVNCTEDFDECTQWPDNPCEHDSACINTPGDFTCNCSAGWHGRICNEDINECTRTTGVCPNGGRCTNNPGSYTCLCPYPYTGTACVGVLPTINIPPTITAANRKLSTFLYKGTTETILEDRGTTVMCSDNDRDKTSWIKVWSIIGLFVIAVLVIACLFVCKKYHRRHRQVSPTNESGKRKLRTFRNSLIV